MARQADPPRCACYHPPCATHACTHLVATQPCASPPSLSLTFMPKGRFWSISAADMNLGRVSSMSKSCVGAVVGLDVGLGGSTWILGGTFLKVRLLEPE